LSREFAGVFPLWCGLAASHFNQIDEPAFINLRSRPSRRPQGSGTDAVSQIEARWARIRRRLVLVLAHPSEVLSDIGHLMQPSMGPEHCQRPENVSLTEPFHETARTPFTGIVPDKTFMDVCSPGVI